MLRTLNSPTLTRLVPGLCGCEALQFKHMSNLQRVPYAKISTPSTSTPLSATSVSFSWTQQLSSFFGRFLRGSNGRKLRSSLNLFGRTFPCFEFRFSSQTQLFYKDQGVFAPTSFFKNTTSHIKTNWDYPLQQEYCWTSCEMSFRKYLGQLNCRLT